MARTDRRHGPNARRGGEAAHHRAAQQDRARAQEADPGNDLRRDARGIEDHVLVEHALEAIGGDDHHQTGANANHHMRANSRRPQQALALKADEAAESCGVTSVGSEAAKALQRRTRRGQYRLRSRYLGWDPKSRLKRLGLASIWRYRLTSKRIDMNTSNISVLMNDYRDLCQEVMTDPEKRGRYWTERAAKELKDKLENLPSKSSLNANPSMPADRPKFFRLCLWTPVHHVLVDHSANRATSLASAG